MTVYKNSFSEMHIWIFVRNYISTDHKVAVEYWPTGTPGDFPTGPFGVAYLALLELAGKSW